MANYIRTLQAENAALRERMANLMLGIAAFRSHLQSSKFHADTTIQVGDVDARLLGLWREAMDNGQAVHFLTRDAAEYVAKLLDGPLNRDMLGADDAETVCGVQHALLTGDILSIR